MKPIQILLSFFLTLNHALTSFTGNKKNIISSPSFQKEKILVNDDVGSDMIDKNLRENKVLTVI